MSRLIVTSVSSGIRSLLRQVDGGGDGDGKCIPADGDDGDDSGSGGGSVDGVTTCMSVLTARTTPTFSIYTELSSYGNASIIMPIVPALTLRFHRICVVISLMNLT